MTYDATRRPPVVTDLDRQWALDQKSAAWDAEAPELPWEQHVAEQAERFEAHFGIERKPSAEWSGLWRRVWWPKADPSILHPGKAPAVPHPFARRGQPTWSAALEACLPDERRVAERFGIVQFKPSDPRAAIITGAEA